MKPLHVRCFGCHIGLVFFMAGSLLLSACQRAADDEKTKVSITLPGSSKLITQGVAPTPAVIDDSINDKDSYLDIVPSTDVNAKYPVNCYAVVVGGPEQEFKSSFCGRRDKKNNLSHDIDFGPYQALVPVTDTDAPTFDFEVSPGSARQFYVIGLHAINIKSCRDINDNPEKNNLSHPYLLGSSDMIDLQGGVSTAVKINLADPQTGDAKYFDDCVVARDDLKFPLANLVKLDPTLLSNHYVRNPASGDASCEAFDVSLRSLSGSTENYYTDYALGTVNDETAAHLKSFNVANADPYATSFDNANDCAQNVSGDTTFYFQRNEFTKRRWLRLGYRALASRTIKAFVDLPSGTISTIDLFNSYDNISKNSTTVLDTAAPRKILQGSCYPVTTYFLSGDSTKVAAGVTTAVSFDATEVLGTPNKLSVYANSADCTSSASEILGAASVSTGDTKKTFWIKTKLPAVSTPVVFKTHDTSGYRSDSQNLILIGTEADDAINSATRISTLEFWGRSYLSYGAGCVPLHIYYSNAYRTNVPAQGSGKLEYVEDQSKHADIGLYAAEDCSGTEITAANLNTTIANFSAGDTSAVVYMKVKSSPASNYTDPRGLIFSYTENGQTSILGRYELSLNKDGY